MDQDAIFTFMSGFRYGVVSSIADDGSPQSALVGIAVTPQLEIVFDTMRSSRKYTNLIARPRCSFVVGWGGEQTVQYEGIAFEPAGAEAESYREEYFAVWPDGSSRLTWTDLTHFAVKPLRVRLSDFDQSPPLIIELRFPQP
jgi:pyridoxine/pyridoxamine 5'-phosphate oxidase